VLDFDPLYDFMIMSTTAPNKRAQSVKEVT